jgi:MFS family permease
MPDKWYFIMNREHPTRVLLIIGSLHSFALPCIDSSITDWLPALGAESGPDGVMVGGTTAAYIISAAVFIIPFGRFSGIFGRKRTMLSGLPFSLLWVFRGVMCPSWTAQSF